MRRVVQAPGLIALRASVLAPWQAPALRFNQVGESSTDIVLPHKSTASRTVEAKGSPLYSMQEYMDREEDSSFAKKSKAEKLAQATDNPIWLLYALGAMAFVSCYVVMCVRLRKEKMRFDPQMRAVQTFDMPGGPSIGGPFSLVDTEGKRWTNEDFKGKWMYIYFGFTNCPDICPEEMAKMSRLINHLDKKVGKDYWQPLFISVDAKRDDQKAVKEYLKDFHPRILGLTGTAEEVEAAAREYRVFFAVPEEFEANAPDYLVDHSIIMYLMDPEGGFSDYTTKEFTWHEAYTKCLRRMIDFERNKPDQAKADLRVANAASFSENTDIGDAKQAS